VNIAINTDDFFKAVNVTQKFIDELAKYSISIFEVDFDEPQDTQNEIKDWMIKSGHIIDAGYG